MNASNFSALAKLYREELLRRVVPFWETHSPDLKYGGFLTCLERDGAVYDTDKFTWLQARQVWTFSLLHNTLGKSQRWLDLAELGASFLMRHGRDDAGDWYFSLTREGRPLVQPYNLFSDCFAALALGEYSKASGSDQARTLTQATFGRILQRKRQPKGAYEKMVPDVRPMKSLALTMILLNLADELEGLIKGETRERIMRETAADMLYRFRNPETNLLHEFISQDNRFVDSFEGRLLNPGHAIEGMSFLLAYSDSPQTINQAVEVILRTLKTAWDTRFGGLYYFLDAGGHPPLQLEWDQKLWWVHLETLVALARAFRLTREPRCWDWFQKVHDYTWEHFPDPDFGEWFGYLNRRAEVLLSLKGGKWKGFFHLPRALLTCSREFELLAETSR
jgi:N-acylglucosamine 2-epimerase